MPTTITAETAARIHRARASKVEALVAELDRMTVEAGHDPVRSAAGIANMLRGWSDLRWRQLAITCGKCPPSEVSKSLVLQTIVARVTPPKPTHRVKFYDAKRRGVWVREFVNYADAAEFAKTKRLHAKPAQVQEIV